MTETELKSAVYEELAAPPARRVLKVLADADLIRRMDALILASRGGYADRSEFVAEALRDRVEAEEELRGAGPAAPKTLLNPVADSPSGTPAPPGPSEHRRRVEARRFGDWRAADAPTAQRTPSTQTANFGLHNRDFPTLWAADLLGRLTAEACSALAWERYLKAATDEAWLVGERLAAEDLARPSGLKRSAGFPLNRKKREAAEVRFRDHAIGALGRAPRGPVFVFGFVGVDTEVRAPTVALTAPTLQLLAQLKEAGVDDGPPFAPAAWAAFQEHLRLHAPDELAAWRSVLAVMADRPNRAKLVERCDWWTGATADTNVMSYVARGREWGLVELGLREGRYELTALGRAEVTEYENEER